VWSTVASTEFDLTNSVAVGDVIYVGTDDAPVLRVDAGPELEQLAGRLSAGPVEAESYDALRVRITSTWAARRAGMTQASAATAHNVRVVTSITHGSDGLTP
jgi:hypothetical protein